MEIYSWNYINVFLKLNIQRTILEVWSVYRYVETNLKTKGKKVEQHLEKNITTSVLRQNNIELLQSQDQHIY